MSTYMTEEEQIDAIKSFFKEYGKTILFSMMLALILFIGWRYWTQRNEKIDQSASVTYEQMLQSLISNNEDATTLQAMNIVSQYPRTPYASQASFVLAKLAIKNNQFDEAVKNLRWVIDHNKVPAMRQVAALRMARIFIVQDHPEVALETLNKTYDDQFAAVIEEVKGDAYLALKDDQKAKAAYQQAVAKMPDTIAHRKLLEMKLSRFN